MKVLKNAWYTVRFKVNELDRFERNLLDQNLKFYIPKLNKKSKVTALFPGYGFIKHSYDDLNKIRYTRGLINILKFGDNYAIVNNDMINELKKLEKFYKNTPVDDVYSVGDTISIISGPFKDYIYKITSLPSNERITVLLSILGSKNRLSFSTNQIKKV